MVSAVAWYNAPARFGEAACQVNVLTSEKGVFDTTDHSLRREARADPRESPRSTTIGIKAQLTTTRPRPGTSVMLPPSRNVALEGNGVE